MNLQDNIDKLPKWAQSEIRILMMRLEEKTKELNRLNENPESNTIVGWGYKISDDDPPIKYLKNNEQITFKLEKGTVKVRIDQYGELDINSSGGIGSFVIKPGASNCCTVCLI